MGGSGEYGGVEGGVAITRAKRVLEQHTEQRAKRVLCH